MAKETKGGPGILDDDNDRDIIYIWFIIKRLQIEYLKEPKLIAFLKVIK